MKLSEIIVESQNLEEGPLANKIGTAVGKGVGTLAKGVGAVAGGIAGLGGAIKKGFQAGKATVATGGDDAEADAAEPAAPAANAGTQSAAPAAPAATGKPTSAPAKSNTPFGRLSQAAAGTDPDAPADQPAAQGAAPAAATGKPTSAPAADNATAPAANAQATPAETPAAAPEKPAAAPAANDSAYAKAQKAISSLPPEQQKELLTALLADPKVKTAMAGKQPAAPEPGVSTATQGADATARGDVNAGFGFNSETGKPYASAAEQKAGEAANKKMYAAQKAEQEKNLAAAKAANPNGFDPQTGLPNAAPEEPAAAPAPAATTEPAPAKKPRSRKTPPKTTQAEIDADRERIMGVTSDSVIRKGKLVSESESHINDLRLIKRGFERGAADPFGMSKGNSVSNDIEFDDPTGVIPRELIKKVEALDTTQRTQLYSMLRNKRI